MAEESTQPVQGGPAGAAPAATDTRADQPAPASRPASYVAHTIEEIPPADAADILINLPAHEAATVAEFLDPDTAATVLAQMDPPAAALVVAAMQPPEAAVLLSRMNPDDAVDLLQHVADPLREPLLDEMGATTAADLRALGRFRPDTAGGIMTTEVTALPQELTAQHAGDELRRLGQTQEQMYYVYVIDRARRLIGVLSMRDLLLSPPDRRIADIMQRNVLSVPAPMDQEQVAELFRKYKYLAIPVTDGRNRLLGIITVDDVVDVLEQEATEDVQVMFGAGAEERLDSPWGFSFRKRIGWLLVNLATAFLAASVVGFFETTIETLAILALYMPVVAGMGGNASAQAMAVTIRGMGRGEVGDRQLRQVFLREIRVGAMSGLIIGAAAALIAWVFHYRYGWVLGALVAVALLINHSLACVWGAAVPFVMKRLGFDPAQSATIFTTTLTDMVGFFTLLGLASLWLRHLQ